MHGGFHWFWCAGSARTEKPKETTRLPLQKHRSIGLPTRHLVGVFTTPSLPQPCRPKVSGPGKAASGCPGGESDIIKQFLILLLTIQTSRKPLQTIHFPQFCCHPTVARICTRVNDVQDSGCPRPEMVNLAASRKRSACAAEVVDASGQFQISAKGLLDQGTNDGRMP